MISRVLCAKVEPARDFDPTGRIAARERQDNSAVAAGEQGGFLHLAGAQQASCSVFELGRLFGYGSPFRQRAFAAHHQHFALFIPERSARASYPCGNTVSIGRNT